MKRGAPGSFAAHLKELREAAGFTHEELATIAGLSVHAVSALERGERRRPHVETVRALSAALDLSGATRDALVGSARAPAHDAAIDELVMFVGGLDNLWKEETVNGAGSDDYHGRRDV
ncbi:MAG: helix-turn-helix transcriptional regulator [Acidobacteriota bacterium]